MDTLKLFAQTQDLSAPVTFDPDPYLLDGGAYRCVGSASLPPGYDVLQEGARLTVVLDRPGDPRHGAHIPLAELLEQGGFYPSESLDPKTLEQLNVMSGAQSVRLIRYVKPTSTELVYPELSVEWPKLSRALTTLQGYAEARDLREDLREDLENALELLRTVADTLEGQSREAQLDLPF